MRDSFVKEVTFELCPEGWGRFLQAAGIGGGPLQAPGKRDDKDPKGDKAWFELGALSAGHRGWRRAPGRQDELRLQRKVGT